MLKCTVSTGEVSSFGKRVIAHEFEKWQRVKHFAALTLFFHQKISRCQ